MREEIIGLTKVFPTVHFTPTNKNIVVLVDLVSEKTKSGIIKDKKTIEAEKADMGYYLTVVALPTDYNKDLGIDPGDEIIPVPMVGNLQALPFITCPIEGKCLAYIKEYNVVGVRKYVPELKETTLI